MHLIAYSLLYAIAKKYQKSVNNLAYGLFFTETV